MNNVGSRLGATYHGCETNLSPYPSNVGSRLAATYQACETNLSPYPSNVGSRLGATYQALVLSTHTRLRLGASGMKPRKNIKYNQL